MKNLQYNTSEDSKAMKSSSIKYLIIRDNVALSAFSSFYEAYHYGLSIFKQGDFLVQELDFK